MWLPWNESLSGSTSTHNILSDLVAVFTGPCTKVLFILKLKPNNFVKIKPYVLSNRYSNAS